MKQEKLKEPAPHIAKPPTGGFDYDPDDRKEKTGIDDEKKEVDRLHRLFYRQNGKLNGFGAGIAGLLTCILISGFLLGVFMIGRMVLAITVKIGAAVLPYLLTAIAAGSSIVIRASAWVGAILGIGVWDGACVIVAFLCLWFMMSQFWRDVE